VYLIKREKKYPHLRKIQKNRRDKKMKKTMTIAKTNNKITITYFNGEYSEWFVKSRKTIPNDEPKAIDVLFDILLKLLDEKMRGLMVEIGIGMEDMGIGKHLFKY